MTTQQSAALRLNNPTESAEVSARSAGRPVTFTPWRLRVVAFSIDLVAPAILAASLVRFHLLVPSAAWLRVGAVAGCAALVAFVLWNNTLRTARLGATLGKSFTGSQVLLADTSRPPTMTRAILRQLAHILDTIPLLVGWAWPLWDAKRQTFADKAVSTIVVVSGSPSEQHRHHAGTAAGSLLLTVMIATATLCGTTYFQQFRPEQHRDSTAAGIAVIAADTAATALSYTPDTVDTDVANAKSKLTGGFLAYYTDYADTTLVPGARNRGIATHWTVNAAALASSTPDTAVVLAFLRGTTQGADAPEPTDLTSSVRLQMKKIDGQWLIADLIPL
ncbi:RDD family protein [Rhodococcus sp. USK13]|uniref:RDD family protein n=1 Tax=Rhodococcus sp. USK13 TaxID=2806442 RepID=UPI001BCF4737|nr:RDD family protein [Rhodococcus sp. USK13]